MDIISLFYEIHDFFRMYEAHLATHSIPRKAPAKIFSNSR